MDINQAEDENANEIIKKIYDANSKFKKNFLNEQYVNEMKKLIEGMSDDAIRNLISKKIEQIKERNISEEEIEKLECELAILIIHLPTFDDKNKKYWRTLEENARKNKE